MNGKSQTQTLARCGVVAFLLILMLPNLAWLRFGAGHSDWLHGLVIPAAALLITFALFGARLWVAIILLAPFAFLAPAEVFYIARFSHPSDSGTLATIFASNSRETIEYFGSDLLPLAALTLLVLFTTIACAYLCVRGRVAWRHRSRSLVATAAVMLPIVMIAAGMSTAHGSLSERWGASTRSLHALGDLVGNSYPFGVLSRYLAYRSEWNALQGLVDQRKSFRFHSTRVAGPRQIYVLVLGESSTRSHWQLFGYDRPTNPELSTLGNIIPIPDMVTSWPESLAAIPLVLTRQPPEDEHTLWSEASILRAMSEAGFDTWWISNQLPISDTDSLVSIYALEAAHSLYLNPASYAFAGSFDDVLLRPLENAVHSSTQDLFVVLHMMGSHMLYDLRYPESFKRFSPTDSESPDGIMKPSHVIHSAEGITNSYDNTIVFTDHVLASAIRILADAGGISALFFESDHGEALPTSTCQKIGHGFGTRNEFEVPAFFWYSDAYLARYPDRVEVLRRNADKRSMSANTFESLADMTGLQFAGHDPTFSLFDSSFVERPRFVTPRHLPRVDFDNADFDECSIPHPRQ